ncbi:hypothetical protein [Desulfonatronum lacustre]|uniref:hypothetical protein n=1 Tax=Desulfonatronum lacustre TaxID=66849 RepID=UPI0004B1D2F7|nr:hypothetical protein [Desulfonatronum lacustre]
MRPISLRVKQLAATLLHRPPSQQQGASLIFIIAAILIMSALGVGIVRLTTTSTFTELTQDPYQQARYLAESGLNYALTGANEGVYVLADNQGNFTIDRNGDVITVIATVHKETLLEARYRISGSATDDPDDRTFTDYIIEENVFVYGSQLQFSGNIVQGHGATIVVQGDLNTGDFNRGSRISVSNIFIGGNVDLDGGSASLGSSIDPGIILINGDLRLWGGDRDIYGDVYVNGNFSLKDANIHGNVYVKGNIELGWTPWLSNDSRIYYTGSITHPSNYNESILSKCINIDNINEAPGYDDSLEMPQYDVPGPRPDPWYADQGYISSGTLSSGLKIFADSYSSTSWRPTAYNVVIVSKGDITITGLGGSGLTGVLIAPYGKVTFNGSFFQGTVIARDGFFVTSGGTNVTFVNIEDFFDTTEDIPISNQ